MIAGADIRTAAERLEFAAVTGIPCAPVRDIIGADDIDTAYLVQRSVIDRRVTRGGIGGRP